MSCWSRGRSATARWASRCCATTFSASTRSARRLSRRPLSPAAAARRARARRCSKTGHVHADDGCLGRPRRRSCAYRRGLEVSAPPCVRAMCRSRKRPPRSSPTKPIWLPLLLTGGDDYELLLTAAPAVSGSPRPCCRARRAADRRSARSRVAVVSRVVDRDGAALEMGSAGFRHF